MPATSGQRSWPQGRARRRGSSPASGERTRRSPSSTSTSSTGTASRLAADGYHIGYLHRNSIDRKTITDSNTFDFFGPHVQFGFAGKVVTDQVDLPADEHYLPDFMSLVHYVFPNVSISGGHEIVNACIVTDLDEVPRRLLERARADIRAHMAEVSDTEPLRLAMVTRWSHQIRDGRFSTGLMSPHGPQATGPRLA